MRFIENIHMNAYDQSRTFDKQKSKKLAGFVVTGINDLDYFHVSDMLKEECPF